LGGVTESPRLLVGRSRRTGRPQGRPRGVGTRDPAAAGTFLEVATGRRLHELREVVASPGRPSASARLTRTVLRAGVRRVRESGQATPAALAEALSCNEATVYRLLQATEQAAAQLQENSSAYM
jgi:hypothetical protein